MTSTTMVWRRLDYVEFEMEGRKVYKVSKVGFKSIKMERKMVIIHLDMFIEKYIFTRALPLLLASTVAPVVACQFFDYRCTIHSCFCIADLFYFLFCSIDYYYLLFSVLGNILLTCEKSTTGFSFSL